MLKHVGDYIDLFLFVFLFSVSRFMFVQTYRVPLFVCLSLFLSFVDLQNFKQVYMCVSQKCTNRGKENLYEIYVCMYL